jgi:hypothetical protein
MSSAPKKQRAARQPPVTAPDREVAADSAGGVPSPVISGPFVEGTLRAASERTMEPTYELPATLDATTVATVQQALRELKGEVHLDGSKVELVDTAGAQLLAAFALKGPRVHLKASAVLADFLSVTAVASLLSLEQ